MITDAHEIALDARNLRFSYRRPVISDFSLVLHRNEVLGLIGPNGCGKTTVLRLLDGILAPEAGEVLLDGRDSISRLRRREIARRIALVPQNGAVHSYQTVFQFALQGRSPHLSLLGFESSLDEEIVREVLDLTHLGQYADERVHQISGGEKQRLRLARALAQRSDVLLLDEFTANLDVNYQVELMRLVVQVTRQRRLATLVVSHEINILTAFCDRIVLMAGGAMCGIGTPAEVITAVSLQELFGIGFNVRLNCAGVPEVIPVTTNGPDHGITQSAD